MTTLYSIVDKDNGVCVCGFINYKTVKIKSFYLFTIYNYASFGSMFYLLRSRNSPRTDWMTVNLCVHTDCFFLSLVFGFICNSDFYIICTSDSTVSSKTCHSSRSYKRDFFYLHFLQSILTIAKNFNNDILFSEFSSFTVCAIIPKFCKKIQNAIRNVQYKCFIDTFYYS